MYQLPEFTHNSTLSKIAILTSGGDSPGMNPAIRALVRTANKFDIEVVGVHRGYAGLIEEDFESLGNRSVSGLCHRGGTHLRSARCLSFHQSETRSKAAEILRKHQIDALVVIGGDGSLTGAHLLAQEHNIRVIGLPGTIDNDIFGTDDSIGFDTAVTTAVEAVDKISDTAASHDRHFLVEVMGRNSGALATQVALAAGAEMVIIPEHKKGLQEVRQMLAESRREGGESSGIIVVAEGSQTGWSYKLLEELQALGEDPRVCILGHLQRGGAPTAHDRILAATLGNCAIHYLLSGVDNVMVGINAGAVDTTMLVDVISARKSLDMANLTLIEELQR